MDYSRLTRADLLKLLEEAYSDLDSFGRAMALDPGYLHKIEFDLGERIKELRCYKRILQIVSQYGISVDEVLGKIVGVLPDAWQFPELAQASVTVGKNVFKTPGFRKSKLIQTQEIKVSGRVLGRIDICYPVKKIPECEDVFLPGESDLIFGIASLLGDYLDRLEQNDRLAESEKKYKSLFEDSPDAYLIFSDGKVLDCNRACERLIRGDRSLIIGKSPQEISPEYQPGGKKSKDLLPDLVKDAYSSGSKSFEWKHLRFDGSEFLALVNLSKIEFEGKPALFAKWQDITQLKESEDLLRKLSMAVEQSPAEVIITDIDGNIEYVNLSFLKTTGYSLEEVIGKNPRIIQSGKTGKQVYETMWRIITSGKTWQGELLNRKKNGELFWESITISPILDAAGKIINYLAIKLDITDKKKIEKEIRDINSNLELKIRERTAELASINESLVNEIGIRARIEEALKDKSAELENFFNVALDLLCIADTSGRFLKVNKAWEDILGYDTEFLEKSLFLDFVHPEDMEATLNEMGRLSEQNPVLNFTNRYRTIDGGYRYIDWHSVPVGERIYAAARDVTERKRNEEFEFELLQLSTKLTGLPVSEIGKALNLALEKIGRFMNTDRAFIFETDNKTESASISYEWCAQGFDSKMEVMKRMPISPESKWWRTLLSDQVIVIPDVQNIDIEWKSEEEVLKGLGDRSMIIIPMFADNKFTGYCGLVKVKDTRYFSAAEINVLKIWSRMLTSLIHNFNSEILMEQTRQNYETFFNTIDDFLWVLDESGKIVHTNLSVNRRLGYSVEELKGKNIKDIVPTDQSDRISEILVKMDDAYLIPVLDRNGKKLSMETRIQNGVWNGTPSLFGVSKDISQILLSEQKFSKAFESGSAIMAISLFDSGEYVDVNNTFVKSLGYGRDEIIGRTNKALGLFVDPGQRKGILNALNNNVPVRDLEVMVRSKDGGIKTLLLSADSIYIGEQRCMLSVSVDISDRKRTEEELKTARMEAEQANRTKSDFLANMSHEIRTPMNAILGYSELLGALVNEPTQKEYLESIKASGRNLLTLINDILDLSKIEAGRLELEFDYIEVNPFFFEFEKIFAFKTSEKEIEFITNVSSGTPSFIYVDGARLRQVVLNLVGNAVKFTDKGSVSVKVSCENPRIITYSDKKTEEVVDLVVKVIDTGIGIPEEFQKEIFGSFVQVRTKMSKGGTGLGLAISQRLAQLMNGMIQVESVPGKGSTFTLRINEVPFLRSYESTQSNMTIDPAEILFDKATVLVVDDIDENRKFFKDSLRGTELMVLEAVNGISALEILTRIIPDLVVTDIRMPVMDGFELLERIKGDERLKHVPVIAYSASVMKKQKERIHNSQFAGLLIKPVRVSDLYYELSCHLHYRIKSDKSVESDIREDTKAEIIGLDELLESLNGPFAETWKSFELRQPINEIREFGNKLKELGEKHNSRFVNDYGTGLLEAANNFNIEGILKLLHRYGELVEKLKKTGSSE